MDLLRNYVFFLAIVLHVNSQNPKINTTVGEIVGNEITLPLPLPFKKVHQYLGIPFAKPPVGNMRFRKSDLFNITSLPSPFYAKNFSAICPQPPTSDSLNIPQSEDCLYLNIYVPDRPADLDASNRHAVMIWIYGGSFKRGAGSQYDFSTLALAGNIIVVTINYRVGVFGFLSSSDENARGNYGLWDQHVAFQWVHNNIEYFGGDNKRVTIAGESAGAMSVIQHALVPANRGLFQRIIAQSGSMSTPGLGLDRDRSQDVSTLAENVGCKSDHMFDIIECLRTKSVDELLSSSLTFSPSVDGELIRMNTDDIARAAEKVPIDEVEFFRSLDVLSGFNLNEGGFMLSSIMKFLPERLQFLQLDDLNFDYDDWKNHYLPTVVRFSFPNLSADEIMQLVEAQYTPWSSPNDYQLLRLQFEKLVCDLNFVVPAIEMARLHAMSKSSSKNNYMYHFVPKPSVRLISIPSWISGAGHADEILFMMGAFGILGVGEKNAWENDLMIKMMTYWSNFVKSGNPNSPTTDLPNWPKYDMETGEYLLLNKTVTNMSGQRNFFAKEANFWLQLIPDMVAAVTGKNNGNCGNGTSTSAASFAPLSNLVVFIALSLYQCITLLF